MNSGIVLSQASGRPMYLQIIDQVRHRVASGDWPPGWSIPSIRRLAAELRVSVITVKRAYLELEREGVITTRQGKGSCVAEHPVDLGDRLRREELRRHLEAAVEVARILGLTARELQEVAGVIMRESEAPREPKEDFSHE